MSCQVTDIAISLRLTVEVRNRLLFIIVYARYFCFAFNIIKNLSRVLGRFDHGQGLTFIFQSKICASSITQ
ncbi:unnamed protein product [Cylicocyclus nassatus]|uniref:Uncharacterized protein n=1 Tax=Cylicocyclus nassatus TaxID=53992 RepID=A0AA36GYC4_CYLNA|nr:unnamed protein product [Cylicocyclus nassatus]